MAALLIGVAWIAQAAGQVGARPSDSGPTERAAPARPGGAAQRDASIALLGECRRKLRELAQRQGGAAPARPQRSPTLAPPGSNASAQLPLPMQAEPSVAAGAPPHATPAASATAGSGAGRTGGPADAGVELELRMLGAVLGASPEEAPILREYLCAVSDLRAATVSDLREALGEGEAAEPAATERALEEARRQRRTVLSDLKQRVGEDRYDALRSVGGLGLMGSLLDCER
jgi:hypothetical protein